MVHGATMRRCRTVRRLLMPAAPVQHSRVVGSDGRVRFDAWVRDRRPALLRAAVAITRDRDSAEDLLQTTLTKVYLSWDDVRDQAALDGYARRVMANTQSSWWTPRVAASGDGGGRRRRRPGVRDRRVRRRRRPRGAAAPAAVAAAPAAVHRRAPLPAGALGGRDRAPARRLDRGRQVPEQPRARDDAPGLPARHDGGVRANATASPGSIALPASRASSYSSAPSRSRASLDARRPASSSGR